MMSRPEKKKKNEKNRVQCIFPKLQRNMEFPESYRFILGIRLDLDEGSQTWSLTGIKYVLYKLIYILLLPSQRVSRMSKWFIGWSDWEEDYIRKALSASMVSAWRRNSPSVLLQFSFRVFLWAEGDCQSADQSLSRNHHVYNKAHIHF